uniref:Peptidase n=1 Tax=Dulem virus 238 TaxID=3145715 RepID=A0AAU8AUE8_9VIRU
MENHHWCCLCCPRLCLKFSWAMNVSLMSFIETLLENNYHFTVTSAKRTFEQNFLCKGSSNSQHLVGEAIDIKPYGFTSYNMLLTFIKDNYQGQKSFSYDQLILYPTFIHISFSDRMRCQTIDKR